MAIRRDRSGYSFTKHEMDAVDLKLCRISDTEHYEAADESAKNQMVFLINGVCRAQLADSRYLGLMNSKVL